MVRRVLRIRVKLSEKKLSLMEESSRDGKTLLVADIVSGCEGSGTPPGHYKAGKWIKDKTHVVHGPEPWSKSPWTNPYGPFFLELLDAKTGKYTTYGIHGTRGPMFGGFEKPPLPEWALQPFLGEDAKYLYCSHGCIRLSNQNITRLFELTARPENLRATIPITVER